MFVMYTVMGIGDEPDDADTSVVECPPTWVYQHDKPGSDCVWLIPGTEEN